MDGRKKKCSTCDVDGSGLVDEGELKRLIGLEREVSEHFNHVRVDRNRVLRPEIAFTVLLVRAVVDPPPSRRVNTGTDRNTHMGQTSSAKGEGGDLRRSTGTIVAIQTLRTTGAKSAL